METYESPVKSISASQEEAFARLSDLSSLSGIFDRLQDDRIKNVRTDSDSVYCTVDPFGEIGLRIIEREPCKTIKFESDKSPLSFNMWIQLVGVNDEDTRMKMTLKADIPFFMKAMIGDNIKKGLDILASALAAACNKQGNK